MQMCRECRPAYKATWLESNWHWTRRDVSVSVGDCMRSWNKAVVAYYRVLQTLPDFRSKLHSGMSGGSRSLCRLELRNTYGQRGQLYGARGGVVTWGAATSRNVASSIPVALGSTEPRTNEYQEYFQGCKGGRCVGLTNLPLHLLTLEIWASSALWNP